MQINRNFLNKLLENPKIPTMNMMEVVNFIYDATYMQYSFKFFEEKARREKYEQKVIDKVEEITKLEAQINLIISTVREYVPEEVIKKLEDDTQILVVLQGGKSDQGTT